MAEQDLLNAFNDCIDRLAAGQSIDECLRRYPQFAAALRTMLETGQQVRAMRVSPVEVAQVQERARYRFEEAVRMTAPRRKPAYPVYHLASLAAAILLISVVILGGAGVMAQASLPGDPLYGVKLFTEKIQVAFDPNLATQFDQRRIDETQQLINTGRTEDVSFRGEVAFVDATHWTVASLRVTISPDTRGAAAVHDGDIVEVQATTTSMGEIIANSVIVLVEKPPTPTPLPTHVPTAFPVTARPTATDTPTITSTPSITPTPSPSLTGTPTAIPTITYTPSPSSTAAPTLTLTPSATACIPTAPAGWVSYQVQPGDSLSRLATSRNITLNQLMAVNCLVDPGFIVAGEELYLPAVQQIGTTPQPTSEGSDNNTNLNDNASDNSGGGDNNSGSGSSNSNDNNDNGDDHGGHGSDG